MFVLDTKNCWLRDPIWAPDIFLGRRTAYSAASCGPTATDFPFRRTPTSPTRFITPSIGRSVSQQWPRYHSNPFFSPINQISFGISNLLSNNTPLYNKSAPAKQMSWSSVAKKEPLQPVKPLHNLPRQPAPAPARTSLNNKTDSKTKPGHVSSKVTETAISAGYRFKARNPEPDPRYPSDQQLMVGPIPGELIYSVILN